MQFSSIIILAAMTVTSAIALPSPNGSGGSGGGGSGGGGSGGSGGSGSGGSGGSGSGADACGDGTTQLCCDTGALLGLTCVLSSLLGSSACSAQTICCVNNGGSQTCTNTDGTTVTVPITIGISL